MTRTRDVAMDSVVVKSCPRCSTATLSNAALTTRW